MRTTWRTEAPQLLLLGAMFLLTVLSWRGAPDSIPVHWNVAGEADRYGGKVEGLLLLPTLALALYLLLRLLPRIDPRRASYAHFAGAYTALRLGILGFLAILHGVVLLWVRGYMVSMSLVIGLALGGLFILIGAVLGEVEPNWFVGIRTPWTLTSASTWRATHRVGARVFALMGLVTILTGLLRAEWAVVAMIVVVLAGTLGLVVYSYLVWRDAPDRQAGTAPHHGPG